MNGGSYVQDSWSLTFDFYRENFECYQRLRRFKSFCPVGARPEQDGQVYAGSYEEADLKVEGQSPAHTTTLYKI